MRMMTFLIALFQVLNAQNAMAKTQISNTYYSKSANEYEVNIKHVYKLTNEEVTGLAKPNPSRLRKNLIENSIMPTIKYSFGPLTRAENGGIKDISSVVVDWKNITKKGNDYFVSYVAKTKMIADKEFARGLNNGVKLALPFNEQDLLTPKWKLCTDSAPDHQTVDFFWYFWDPSRYGCDHKEGVQYGMATIESISKTTQTTKTYPEYKNMIRMVDGKKVLSMTFGFGFVEDSETPNPFKDRDSGAVEFRKFLNTTKSTLSKNVNVKNFKELPIKASQYDSSNELEIGRALTFTKDDINYEIKIVMSATVDQMELFAKSFAKDDDAYFAWLGHSRVGNGFDAEEFERIVESRSESYSISKNYQLIYWGGCNSYSYYTTPFFKIKSDEQDLRGTKNLDIVSNGLPSLFSFNAANAAIFLNALTNLSTPKSYQEIVDSLEDYANSSYGTKVLVNVLGDEDNVLN